MFSVNGTDEAGGDRGYARRRASAPARSAWVLPRYLRKPVRFVGRVVHGNVTPPRFAALAMTLAYLGGSVVYGAALGGYMPVVAQAVTARTGFAVNEIAVTGNKEVSEIDVLDQLDLTGWTSLVGFDASAARDRIAKLAWVQNASVRKAYPDKIEVDLVEHKPFALWQHDGQVSIVEDTGRIIAAANRSRELPLIVGLGAPEAGDALMKQIAAFPAVAEKVSSYVRVANRRWDLKLKNGLTIMLPEYGVEAALGELAEADEATQLMSRDIALVDLRIAGRLVVALTDAGQQQMAAKAAKAKERT